MVKDKIKKITFEVPPIFIIERQNKEKQTDYSDALVSSDKKQKLKGI